jgi:hypothetical protein
MIMDTALSNDIVQVKLHPGRAKYIPIMISEEIQFYQGRKSDNTIIHSLTHSWNSALLEKLPTARPLKK